MNFDLITLLQVAGPPLAVYVAIRVDLAVAKLRLDHIEAELKDHREDRNNNRRHTA